ncbi:MAG: hypothetical protein IT349_06730 [Candidatus Eisenbacteria bacterium]|nr:hypothetical protein [Candidatus Eisenbacteria bacterium]MCC7141784.1 hypothetical protein [Candidatus Eisenbacteria bacterium]
MQNADAETIERELRALSAVQTARVEFGDAGEIAIIHAVAAPGRKPGSVAREIRTALLAHHGIDLSRDQISIAGQRTLRLYETEPGDVARVEFKSVNVFRENQRAEAQVELRRGGRLLIGTASGAAIRRSLPRLVGRATVQALSQLSPPGVVFELVAVERRRLGVRPALLVHLVLLQGRRETHLMGSVFQAGDPLEATALAVLDATNRLLPTLEGDDAVEYHIESFGARAKA